MNCLEKDQLQMLTNVHKAIVAILLLAMIGQAAASALASCEVLLSDTGSSHRTGDTMSGCHQSGSHDVVQDSSNAIADPADCNQGTDCCPGACTVMALSYGATLEFHSLFYSASRYTLQLAQRADTLFRPPIVR